MTTMMTTIPNTDSLGITGNLDDAQIDTIASAVRIATTALPFIIGDLYNQKCRILGITAGGDTRKHSHTSVRINDALEALCDRMGVVRRTAENYAVLSRRWPRQNRVGGLFIKHYTAVAGMDTAAAVALLQQAQMGDQQPDGTWVKPWTVDRLIAERAKLEGKPIPQRVSMVAAKAALKGELSAVVATTLPEVEKVLDKVALTPAKKKSIAKKVEKALETEYVNLQSKFKEAVEKETAARLPEEAKKAEASARRTFSDGVKLAEDANRVLHTVRRPITEGEFKQLRSFCHEDKFQDPEMKRKAKIVSTIINRIGAGLGYIKG